MTAIKMRKCSQQPEIRLFLIPFHLQYMLSGIYFLLQLFVVFLHFLERLNDVSMDHLYRMRFATEDYLLCITKIVGNLRKAEIAQIHL